MIEAVYVKILIVIIIKFAYMNTNVVVEAQNLLQHILSKNPADGLPTKTRTVRLFGSTLA